MAIGRLPPMVRWLLERSDYNKPRSNGTSTPRNVSSLASVLASELTLTKKLQGNGQEDRGCKPE